VLFLQKTSESFGFALSKLFVLRHTPPNWLKTIPLSLQASKLLGLISIALSYATNASSFS
jgi:hypothetical protein